MLKLQLLGQPTVYSDDRLIKRFPTQKTLALLTYLTIEANIQHTRASLIALLFPEVDGRKGRQSLSQTLSRLRRTLGKYADLLDTTRHTITLTATDALDLDHYAFASAVDLCNKHRHERLKECQACQAVLAEAVTLVRGELLEGFDVGDSSGFEEWLLLERARLHDLHLDTLYKLAAGALERGDHEAAVAYARRQIELEAWREKAYRQLMVALVRSGQRATATAQFNRCREILAQELGVEPTAETRNLLEQLQQVSAPTEDGQHVHNNLPHTVTPFIGRETEIAELVDQLQNSDYRLVTVLGQGGLGKTRLVLEVGYDFVAQQRGYEVFFVSLVGVVGDDKADVSAEKVASAIAETLDLQLGGAQPSRVQVATQLRERKLLLILDNFEEVVNAGAWLVELLAAGAQLCLLVTSRERLKVSAEQLYWLDGLPTPPHDANRVQVRDYAAVQLFIDRARRIAKTFRLSDENWPHLVTICRKLEGLPLGIELAATWVQDLTLAQIAANITQSIDFLETDLNDVAPRQRSVREVYATSWARLSGAEQRTLARLAVMQGVFDATAALTITETTPLVLRRLRYKSLLRSAGIGRMDIHELVRQFSAEKLPADTPVHNRHAVYYLDLIASETARLDTRESVLAVQHIRANLTNIRSAWERAVEATLWAEIDAALLGMTRFLSFVGLWDEIDALLEKVLTAACAAGDAPPRLIANLRVQQAYMGDLRKDAIAIELAEQALSTAQSADARDLAARAYCSLASGLCYQGDNERAFEMATAARKLAAATNQDSVAIDAYLLLGVAASQAGNYAEARRQYGHALTLGESSGCNYIKYSDTHGLLGNIDLSEGKIEDALHKHQTFLTLCRDVEDERGEALARIWLSATQYELGQYDEIIVGMQRAAAIVRQVGDFELESAAEYWKARALLALGRVTAAHKATRRFSELDTDLNTPNVIADAHKVRGDVLLAMGELASAMERYQLAREAYAQLQSPQVILMDGLLADIALRQGDSATAAELIESACAWLASSAEMMPTDRRQLQELCRRVRASSVDNGVFSADFDRVTEVNL